MADTKLVNYLYINKGERDKLKRDTKTLEGHNYRVNSVAYSPDGRYIVSGSNDRTIKIWDGEKCIKTLEGHNYSVNSVAYSPDGRYIVSGSDDGTIKIWDAIDITNHCPTLDIVELLLKEDKIRADLMLYNQKILEDTEQGHWSLWREDGSDIEDSVKITISEPLVARDPKSSIVDGVVGIDFGTKSTVVVYQKDSDQTLPMRIGTGDLSKEIQASHYENPTIMEFNDIQAFIEAYKKRDGRPFTKWQDLTISHTAYNNLLNNKSDYFNAYVSELKQWAGTKSKKLKIKDKKGFVVDLPEYANMSEDDIDPIEIYAYYLGLYINNHTNGIYLNYILSFPVTYEVEIRERILNSFKKGLKKSLPQELHNQKEVIEKLKVEQGASEPAAYAVIALLNYNLEPEDGKRVFYGVFDFGGGTTDFDFGIFREAQGKKERRFDYTIEHFGAGGDRYLGGENLLELLAFEIFKKNKEKLLQDKIQFIKPEECREFLGSENLLSLSREAKMNTKRLMEKLRPFWEGDEETAKEFEEKAVVEVNLLDINANQLANYELDIEKDELKRILRERIKKGVVNFFNSLREVFANTKFDFSDIEQINIFLAGNSSKSKILRELFDEAIEEESKKFKKHIPNAKEIFKLYEPLKNDDDFAKPNGKTGVAFGLIETRKSGDIYVIDHNIKQDEKISEINFKYYLGESRKKKFKVIIDRTQEYNKWVEFIDATIDSFEVYYSSSTIVTTNKVDITDNSIKKKILDTGVEDENANIYIRLVTPTEFEYVVAYEDKLEQGEYLSDIVRVAL